MADVAAQPFINYGASIADQESTMANTGLTRERTSALAMQNQLTRATMPMIMSTIQDLTGNQSGSNPGAPGSPEQQRAQDASGVAGYNADSLEDSLRTRNYVQPYTQDELRMLKAGTALSLNPQTAPAGAALVERMKVQQQARTANQTASNQLQMGNTYDAASAVATMGGPTGTGAFKALMASFPADARVINPEAAAGRAEPTADDDAKAQAYAKHLAGVSFLYSGRPHELQNGKLIDTAAGKAVTGQDQVFTGLTPEQRQKEYDRATEQIEWTDKDGRLHKDQRWKAPAEYGGYGGVLTPAQAVLAADQAARHAPDGAATQPPGIIPNAAVGSGTAPPTHGAAAAANVRARAAATPPQTGADIAAGKAPATSSDQGVLANPASFTKVVSPVAGLGPGTAGTVGTEMQKSLANRNDEAIKESKSAFSDAQTMRSQITQAKAEIAKIDPRTIGPGSTVYRGILQAITAAAGKAPDALVDETVLDKFLNQIGASNVRNLLAGQRITNQEMMTFLTRGSPSTSMPLGGITHLLNYLDADNEYTLRYNRTKMMALKSGADPDLVDQEISDRVRRSDYVARKTGSGDTLGQAQKDRTGPPAIASQADYDKLPAGAAYTHPDHPGVILHKGGS